MEYHENTVHDRNIKQCDECSYVGIHTRDLNRHKHTMHEGNDENTRKYQQKQRTFYPTSRNQEFKGTRSFRNQDEFETRQEQRRNIPSKDPNQGKSRHLENINLNVNPVQAASRPWMNWSFTQYYHQPRTFNIEGYKRNKFYLSNLIKKHKFMFLFLQEHWLPHHEANKILT